MKAFVNTYALRNERLDSRRLSTLAMIAHPVAKDGVYAGTILDGQIEVGHFAVEARDEFEVAQADVDVARLASMASAGERMPARAKVRTGGYLMLFVSEGQGGYRIVLDRLANAGTRGKKPLRVFDSAKLGKGDLFIVTLIRPGLWRMAEAAGAEGTIKVAYPNPGKKPYRPDKPAHVKMAGGNFRPKQVSIGAAQGVVFEVDAEQAALVVELKERDDGPPNKQLPTKVRRRVHWKNPKRR